MTTALARRTLADFIGIPYKELGRTHEAADCWGLVLLAGRELFGIEYPEYFYTEAEILAHACEHIRRETALPHWTALGQAEPHPLGAIHIFRIRGFETHCGIDIGGGDFLHSLAGRNSCVESLRSLLWSHCRTGTYQWTP